jgi:D-tyrosyl-tRNA(Tyr) deacylase
LIALIQRVASASVTVAGERIAAIARGLVAYIAIETDDSEREAARLVQRVLGYRVFADADGRMNRSLTDLAGGLLLVPQFTLAADTARGMRPSFTPAAPPALGAALFERVVQLARAAHGDVAVGRFGADMQVALVNDGPVTFWLRTGTVP